MTDNREDLKLIEQGIHAITGGGDAGTIRALVDAGWRPTPESDGGAECWRRSRVSGVT